MASRSGLGGRWGWRWGVVAGEGDDALIGEELEGLGEGEAERLELGAGLGGRHLVGGLDREGGVLAAVLDEDQAAGLLEGAADAADDGRQVGQLVVDVDEQDEVAAARRELGVGLGGELEQDVGQPLAGDARRPRPAASRATARWRRRGRAGRRGARAGR